MLNTNLTPRPSPNWIGVRGGGKNSILYFVPNENLITPLEFAG